MYTYNPNSHVVKSTSCKHTKLQEYETAKDEGPEAGA